MTAPLTQRLHTRLSIDGIRGDLQAHCKGERLPGLVQVERGDTHQPRLGGPPAGARVGRPAIPLARPDLDSRAQLLARPGSTSSRRRGERGGRASRRRRARRPSAAVCPWARLRPGRDAPHTGMCTRSSGSAYSIPGISRGRRRSPPRRQPHRPEALGAEAAIVLAHEHRVIALTRQQRGELGEWQSGVVGPLRMHVERGSESSSRAPLSDGLIDHGPPRVLDEHAAHARSQVVPGRAALVRRRARAGSRRAPGHSPAWAPGPRSTNSRCTSSRPGGGRAALGKGVTLGSGARSSSALASRPCRVLKAEASGERQAAPGASVELHEPPGLPGAQQLHHEHALPSRRGRACARSER